MKLRTVLISVVVSAALVGGAGYGAYYVAQSRKAPIEVVPVANVSQGYWGMEDQQVVYGSVTSQVAQTVQLNDEYGIDKIYVEVGDEVKEGTPLFSYDMTLQELELEMQQLDLQTNELTMTRLEKELEKLKKTPATASLERNWFTLTASAEEDVDAQDAAVVEDEDETPGSDPAYDETNTGKKHSGGSGGIEVDEVEKVGGSKAGAGLSTVENSVLSFEGLVLELQATFLTCGDDLKAEDVGEAIEQAVVYYRKNLADEKKTEEVQEDGSVKEIRTYVLKDSVRKALDKEETESLRKRCITLDEYQVKYVEMLIAEAEDLEGSALLEAVGKIVEVYGQLDAEQQDRVENLERFEELKVLADEAEDQQTESGETGEAQTDAGQLQDGEVQTDAGQLQDDEMQTNEEQPQDSEAQTNPEADAQNPDGEDGRTEDSGDGAEDVRRNTVAFDVSEGAATTVDGQDVTNSIAMAENGKIVFGVSLENGYEITEVLVDGTIPARKNEASEDPDDYIIEGIQTNDTIVSVRTQLNPDVAVAEENSPENIADNGTTGGEGSGDGTTGGETSGDETTGGETSGDGTTGGETSGDETTGGETSGDGTTGGETSGDGTTGGETSGDGTTGGETSGDEKTDGTTSDSEATGGEPATGETTSDSEAAGGEPATEGTTEEPQGDNPAETKEYTVTLNPGNRTELHEVGRLVPLQADLSDVTLVFMGWSVAPTSGDAAQTVELNGEDVGSGYASFLMPEFDVTATARYENAPDAINSYVTTFLSNAEMLLAENAAQTYADQGKDFLTELENAVVFYQQWLSNPKTEILDETEMKKPEMEKYQLLSNVSSYLKKNGKEFQVKQLKERYRDLCLLYTEALFEAIDPGDVDRELLDRANDAYSQLGEKWRKKLEKRWLEEQAELADQAGMSWEKDEQGELIAPEDFLSIGDSLKVYDVMQLFQEYQNLPEDTPEDERYDMLLDIWSRYTDLNDAQRLVLSSDPYFVETFRMYGLWDEEPETEFPYHDYDDYWDPGFPDDEPMYTAEELAEMIRDKEQEIKACSLDIRQSELDLKQKQRIIDGKVVKSTMDGTVVSIGGPDGESDEDYFVKVTNETGLYAKGTMNELALEKINVGDTISGTLTTNGISFTAVIKEVSEYPDANGQYMSYGQENTNASYYPFYALIDDTEGLEEGDAEIYLSGQAPGGEDGKIYLENYFVRSETDGRTYVYKKGDDDKLTKQYVKTGKNTGWSLEIQEGLTFEDEIAFPYGKNVKEGAKTKSVDQLQDAFM